MEYKINQAQVGLNTDSVDLQIKEGQLTFALNAIIESFDGNVVTYQNETGNTLCANFPEGYSVIGFKSITSMSRLVVFLVNTTTNASQIGYIDNNSCNYVTLIDDSDQDCKMNFSIEYPIHKVVTKTTNCSTQIYWTDGLNPRRYLDFDDLPWQEDIDSGNDYKRIKKVGFLDCNKLNVQPDFKVPHIELNEVAIGGSLTSGTYQFAVQYSNEYGEGYTSYYNVTNPVSIFETADTPNFDNKTSKAINITVKDLDTTGFFEYFNIAVVSSINGASRAQLIGTFPIAASVKNPASKQTSFNYTYTGAEVEVVDLAFEDIFTRFPYYDVANDLTAVDNVLVWADLKNEEEINCQQIWNNVKTQWETYQIPYNEFEGYKNGVNSAKYRSYMRDEVYAFEGVLVLKNGKELKASHIPGRIATATDRAIIDNNNADNVISFQSDCGNPEAKERWEVYNTATVTGYTEEFTNKTEADDCYVGSYQYGEFAYWESDEKYPNNVYIWGNLANTPIRHPKFPDVEVSPFHNQNDASNYKNFDYLIYPIGIKVDVASLQDAILNSNLSQELKDNIVGFKILRGNRATNKSIIAKGLLNNVGESKYEDETQYYPNYPFNDVTPDNFYNYVKMERGGVTYQTSPHVPGIYPTGRLDLFRLNGFSKPKSSRFAFHSPDTHFYQPTLSNQGQYLKVESIIYGKSFGHFVSVDDNAEYKFLTRKTLEASAGIALVSGMTIAGGTFGTPTFSLDSAPPTYLAMNDIFEKITPFRNFGYAHHALGIYGNYYKVPNDQGIKNRKIDFIRYATDGAVKIEDGNTLNNYRRESSIYLHIDGELDYPHNYHSSVPNDYSRYTLGLLGDNKRPEEIRERDISSYYGAIKKYNPSQWGRLYSYETIDTGFYFALYDEFNNKLLTPQTVFGGDTFINRFAFKNKLSLFRRTTVGQPNQADIDYNEIGNLNYPMYWISTRPANFDINVTNEVNAIVNELSNSSVLNILANIASGGGKPAKKAQDLLIALFKQIYQTIGIKDVNLDNGWDPTSGLSEEGIMYLYVYGIPYYFCESEVNVDYRQAYNQKEGDFYPNVGGDIPDDWLQENNVPILFDNTYTYNQTYSKQNKELYVSHLKESFDPEEKCFTNFPNRVIWSDKSNVEETKNNWLTYRPSSRFDLPKSYGDLTAIDNIQNNQVLTRFENKSQIYNALTTVDVSVGPKAYLGNANMFSAPPVDLSETDIGYAGSQHKLLLKTEFGNVFVDSKRGQVILLSGNNVTDLSKKGMTKWFKKNLPFYIHESDPTINIDNSFNKIGLSGVYDSFYKRIILTKKDYKLKDNVSLPDGVEIGDPTYYIDKSWTVSFSFNTDSWVSYHSYIPAGYIGYSNHYQTYNEDLNSLWDHNKTYTLYNNYYGEIKPYIIEYNYNYKFNDEILQSVKDYCSARIYTDFDTWYEPDETIYFNKSVISTDQQCTGILNLIPKPLNNMQLYLQYPKFNSDSKDIIVTKSDNFYNYNTFWDITKDRSKPLMIDTTDPTIGLKEVNQDNMDYTKMPSKEYKIRSKKAKLRNILDNRDDVKLISKFTALEVSKSYK